MKIVFILNNKKDRLARILPEIKNHCEGVYPGEVRYMVTQRKKHAVQLAREAAVKGCEYLIAVGGDGTLHEVVNGVLQSGLPPVQYPVIGLLPYGSANDFAR